MVALDTTFVIDLLLNRAAAVEKSKSLPSLPITTRINVFEVLVGIYHQNPKDAELTMQRLNTLLSDVRILELDAESADLAARLSADLRIHGNMVADSDVLIAAIALANGEEKIITKNAKDFAKIKGIKVESY